MNLQRGTKLFYAGYELTPSVEILGVLLPGHPEHDGGLPGIVFRYLKRRGRPRWFFPCKTAKEFFADERFANLTDQPPPQREL